MTTFRRLTLAAATIGAVGLATLTIEEPRPAQAADPAASTARAGDPGFLVPLLFKVGDDVYYSFDDDLKPSGYLDLAQATRKAGWVHVDRLSDPTAVTFADGTCLAVVAQGTGQRATKKACSSAANARQKWAVGASSLWSAAPIVAGAPALSYALPDATSLGMRAIGAQYTFFAGAAHRWTALSVTATTVDQKAATAHISGKARPSSTLLVDDDATRRIPVGSDGKWTYDATGLAPGLNRIQFDEYVGTWKSATTQANVTIDEAAPRELTLDSPKPGTPFDVYVDTYFRGHGTPGAAVTLHTANFAEPDISAEVGTDGSWVIPKFLGRGPYDFDFTQSRGTGGGLHGLHYEPVPLEGPPTPS